MPKVSVIIPCYNYGRYLARAVDSVLSQTFSDFELLVVDDASTDDTALVAQGYADRKLLRLIRRKQNKGLSAARNLGMENATGEYLVFLDADDTIAPEKLARQVEFLDKHTAAALVYSDVEYVDEAKHATRYFPGVLARYGKLPQGDVFEELLSGNFMTVNSVMVRASCVAAAGLFDENLRAMEDWDMWLRICMSGGAGYIDSVLASVFVHKNSMSADTVTMRLAQLSILLKLEKSCRAVSLDVLAKQTSLAKRYLADAYNKRGLAAYEAGDFSGAAHSFAQSIRTCPVQKMAYLKLAMAKLSGLRGTPS